MDAKTIRDILFNFPLLARRLVDVNDVTLDECMGFLQFVSDTVMTDRDLSAMSAVEIDLLDKNLVTAFYIWRLENAIINQ